MAEITSYIGDGVYASFDGFYVWIWTSNGIEQSEKIGLEPSVLNALNAFSDGCRKAAAEHQSS